MGEGFDVVAAAPGIDDFADPRFVLEEELGVPRDAGREVRRQGDRFVKRVGVEALGVAEGRRHRLDTRPRDVVEGVLLRQRPTGGLRVRAQGKRLRVLRVELVN